MVKSRHSNSRLNHSKGLIRPRVLDVYRNARAHRSLAARLFYLEVCAADAKALIAKGDKSRALGARLEANFVSLDVALLPASSLTALVHKRALLRAVAGDLRDADQGHVARLVEIAIEIEGGRVDGSVDDFGVAVAARMSRQSSDNPYPLQAGQLRHYARIVRTRADISRLVGTILMARRHAAWLHGEGRFALGEGAASVWRNSLVSLCTLVATSRKEAGIKIEILQSESIIACKAEPFLAPIFQAAITIESRRWLNA